MAQDMFEKDTGCIAPTYGNLAIINKDLKALNRGNNVFTSDGLAITTGLYQPQTDVIYLASELPDQSRTLFHEFLHFMFARSSNCAWVDIKLQHKIIPYMERKFFIATEKPKLLGNQWLIKAILEIK